MVVAAVLVVIIAGGILLTTNKTTPKQTAPFAPTQTPPPQVQQGEQRGELPTTFPEQISDVTVNVTSDGYSPSTLTVKDGTRVNWINKSGTIATVHSAGHPTHQVYPPLNLGEFPDGSSVQLVFDKPGTYKYHNHLNPSMNGTVIVQ